MESFEVRKTFVELLEQLDFIIVENTNDILIVSSELKNIIEYKWTNNYILYNELIGFHNYTSEDAIITMATLTKTTLDTKDEQTIIDNLSKEVGFKLESKHKPLSKEEIIGKLKSFLTKNQ